MANTPKQPAATNEDPALNGDLIPGSLMAIAPAVWEYKILGISSGGSQHAERLLNQFGEDGWEVVGINPHRPEVILKRAKVAEAEGELNG